MADEILVDLMRTASGIDYGEAAKDLVVREVGGVPIPFASPRLLWRMKVVSHREKDTGDLVFLRYWFAGREEQAPEPDRESLKAALLTRPPLRPAPAR